MDTKARHIAMMVTGFLCIAGAILILVIKDKPDTGIVVALISAAGPLLMFSDPKKAARPRTPKARTPLPEPPADPSLR